MATILRQLIKTLEKLENESYNECTIFHFGLRTAINQAEDLLERDDKQIVDAVIYGNENPLMASPKMLGEEYLKSK